MKIGIDLGTSQSSAVATLATSRVLPVKDPLTGGFSVPSVIGIGGDGGWVCGSVAANQARGRPDAFRSEFKRDLEERIPVSLAGRDVWPEELIEQFLAYILSLANTQAAAEPIDASVVCVPAAWGPQRRDLVQASGVAAGLPEATLALIDEPVAASWAALADEGGELGERFLVFDWGGGTFDAALMRVVADGHLEVIDVAGLANLGGRQIDRLLMRSLLASSPVALELVPQAADDPLAARQKLAIGLEVRDVVRSAKHVLSQVPETSQWLTVGPNPFEWTMSRAALAALIDPLCDQAHRCCDDLLTLNGLAWGDLSRVILVGGTCRTPHIVERVQAHSGRPCRVVGDPELAVAHGAALLLAATAPPAPEAEQAPAYDHLPPPPPSQPLPPPPLPLPPPPASAAPMAPASTLAPPPPGFGPLQPTLASHPLRQATAETFWIDPDLRVNRAMVTFLVEADAAQAQRLARATLSWLGAEVRTEVAATPPAVVGRFGSLMGFKLYGGIVKAERLPLDAEVHLVPTDDPDWTEFRAVLRDRLGPGLRAGSRSVFRRRFAVLASDLRNGMIGLADGAEP